MHAQPDYRTTTEIGLGSIKDATKPYHLRLEKTWLSSRLLSNYLTKADYVKILQRWYQCWYSLELWLETNKPNHPIAKQLMPLKRTHKLVTDIRFLKGTLPDYQPLEFNEIPTQSIAGGWFGVAYVVEGSHLGSFLICRHIKNTLNLEKDTGCSFFNNCRDDNKAPISWKQWLLLFNTHIDEHQLKVPATNAAISVFEWLEDHFSYRME